MKSFTLISVFLYLCCSASAESWWWNCDDGLPGPNRVTSPHCSGDRCLAVRGEMLTARVYISSPQSHNELMVTATVFIGGVGVPLPPSPPPHDNGCNSLFIGTTQHFCPTQPNVEYTWVVNEEIPTTLPTWQNARLQYRIVDRGTVVGCVNLLATLL